MKPIEYTTTQNIQFTFTVEGEQRCGDELHYLWENRNVLKVHNPVQHAAA